MKRLSLLILMATVISACTTARAATPPPSVTPFIIQGDNPYAPQPGDDALVGDTVEFVSAEAVKLGSMPEQVQLNISYRLPTPCHQTRLTISPLGSDNKINIKMYSLMEKDKPCALMPLSTPSQASLSLGSLPSGHYKVYVNDVLAVEFDQ